MKPSDRSLHLFKLIVRLQLKDSHVRRTVVLLQHEHPFLDGWMEFGSLRNITPPTHVGWERYGLPFPIDKLEALEEGPPFWS